MGNVLRVQRVEKEGECTEREEGETNLGRTTKGQPIKNMASGDHVVWRGESIPGWGRDNG